MQIHAFPFLINFIYSGLVYSYLCLHYYQHSQLYIIPSLKKFKVTVILDILHLYLIFYCCLLFNKHTRLKLMGQSCKTPQLNAIHGLPLQKTSNNLCETASFQQKSEPESPFCHLSQVVTSKIRELNYKPEQLQSIAKYPIHQLPNGLIYQGPLQNNHMNGPCRLAMPDGSYYQGEMAGNQLNGEGLLINPRGQYYIGSFKDNKAEGKGMYVGEDFIYEGEFKKNVYSGKGKLTKLDQIFEGVFEKGKMKKGKLIKLSEQSVYEGEFQGNIENGFGRSTKNNSTYQGIFKNGLIQGEGKVKEENGEELICSFQRGAIVSVIRLSATEGENKQSQQFLSLRGTNHQTV